MKPNKDTVIFELVGSNESSYQDKMGNRKKTTATYGLPYQQTILYTDLTNGEQYEREIRYLKSHRSIFVDEQNESLTQAQLDKVWRLASKPQFTEGLLFVKANQKNLLAFLRNHPMKEGNEHLRVNEAKQRTVFRERNPADIARKNNEATKKQIKAESLVFTADFETKIVPIAKYLGIDTDREADLILWDVKVYAIQNGDRFLELMDSPIVGRFVDVERAVEYGFIRINGQRILWRDGRQIVEVPTNYSPIEYLSEVSFEQKYHSTWNEIQRLLDKENTPEKDAETVVEETPDVNSALDSLSAKDLYLELKERGIITWKPPFYVLDYDEEKSDGEQTRIARSAEDAIKYVGENKKVLAARLI
jgi:hypothetical protein